ncbi:hypothetical protein GGR53DRAFT_279270 [Hypoxylon sp. FL1150]|nr:hypothetical protein GGR53DRAFT_279270 [Hypoxylon sp. FL1150]
MMANDTIPQSISFLTDAAHLLMKTAPETSTYIMRCRNSLMFNNNLEQSDLQKQHVCNACGHIMIPGQGAELKLDADKTARKRGLRKSNTSKKLDGKNNLAVGCRKRFTCGLCNRYTDIQVPSAAPISRCRPTKPRPLAAVRPDAAVLPSESSKVSANASSKKRAKNRKQGLQALLQAQSASKSQSGLGLSLSDFMMK